MLLLSPLPQALALVDIIAIPASTAPPISSSLLHFHPPHRLQLRRNRPNTHCWLPRPRANCPSNGRTRPLAASPIWTRMMPRCRSTTCRLRNLLGQRPCPPRTTLHTATIPSAVDTGIHLISIHNHHMQLDIPTTPHHRHLQQPRGTTAILPWHHLPSDRIAICPATAVLGTAFMVVESPRPLVRRPCGRP